MEDNRKRKIFKCKICGDDKLAEHFANDLNKIPARDLRIVCCRCAPGFNKLALDLRREFLQKEINDFYGKKQYIYVLCEPKTEAIRYVGRTVHPQRRFNNHIQLTRDFARQVCLYSGVLKFECNCIQHKRWNNKIDTKRWIAKLMAKNLKPVMNILEEVTPGWLVAEREIRYICQLIKENHKLLNSENQSKKAKTLIKEQTVSFLEVDIEELAGSGFLNKFQWSLISRESGWHRPLLLHQIFSTRVDLKFDEHNFWDKEAKDDF